MAANRPRSGRRERGTAEDRRLAAADRRVLAARQGGQAGLRGLGGDGQRGRRPARAPGRARHQGRRLQPEHRRLRLQRADQPGQGRPAARHVLVAAQPARPPRSPSATRCSTSSRRAARRRSSAAASSTCSSPSRRRPTSRATSSPNWIAEPAGGPAAEDGRVPDARRPVRDADVEGIEAILEAAGIETVYRETYAVDTRTSTRSPTR